MGVKALNRMWHCLGVLGNEATLMNSVSIWKELVKDAKDRGCSSNTNEDKNLDQAMKDALSKPSCTNSIPSLSLASHFAALSLKNKHGTKKDWSSK
ncbi:hypothetical protein LguiB_032860 [Lonicera macranthoides]